MSIEVRELGAADFARWDEFVRGCEGASFFHLSGWKTVIERAFGHRTCFLYAEQDGRIEGVLPLAEIKSVLFGHSLASLLSYRPRAARVEIDGAVEEGRYQNVVVANGRYFGGGMCVAPTADLGDGLFDVVLFGDLPRLRSLTGIRRIYAGSHIGRPGIRLVRGRRVRVTPLEDPPLSFEMEGEEVGPG